MTGKKYRLPSEAEWEFAARGGTLSNGYSFVGGNDLDQVGWHSGNAGDQPHPVGEKAANELGLHDMSGNVWEWCADHWHRNYNDAPTDGSAWTENNDAGVRVCRGGSWDLNPIGARAALRYGYFPSGSYSVLGFRLAKGY